MPFPEYGRQTQLFLNVAKFNVHVEDADQYGMTRFQSSANVILVAKPQFSTMRAVSQLSSNTDS